MIRCFYHSQDLDGYCSGAIVKYRFPEAVMYPINYGDEFPWDEIGEDDEVYMVDFCLQPFEDMAKLAESCKLFWIDNHKSAMESYAQVDGMMGLAGGYHRAGKAVCELTWEYLFPDRPIPLAVKLLSLYDSWTYLPENCPTCKGKSPEVCSNTFHRIADMVLPFEMRLRTEELDPKDWDKCSSKWLGLFSILSGQESKLVGEGRLLLRYDEANKAKYARTYVFETAFPPDLETYEKTQHTAKSRITPKPWLNAIAVNLGHTNSKVFDSVWRRECRNCQNGNGPISLMIRQDCPVCNGTGYIEPYDLMITFVRRKDKLWNVSLYSTKADVDCGSIAKSFGGGGHKGAAGFQCEELPFEY